MIKSPFTKLFTLLLAFSLLNSSLAVAIISPSLSKNGISTVGANHSGHNRKQTTLASLGGGNIQIGGKKQTQAELKKQGLNTDITQTQKLTKDQQTGGLNASVTVDNRLFSEQGRQNIIEDFKASKDLVADVSDTVLTGMTYALEEINRPSFSEQLKAYSGQTMSDSFDAYLQKNGMTMSASTKQKLMKFMGDRYAQKYKKLTSLKGFNTNKEALKKLSELMGKDIVNFAQGVEIAQQPRNQKTNVLAAQLLPPLIAFAVFYLAYEKTKNDSTGNGNQHAMMQPPEASGNATGYPAQENNGETKLENPMAEESQPNPDGLPSNPNGATDTSNQNPVTPENSQSNNTGGDQIHANGPNAVYSEGSNLQTSGNMQAGNGYIAKELTIQQQKAIRSLEKQIAKHEKKLQDFKDNPTVRPGMENLPKEVIQKQQQRRTQHLETEINTFKNNIDKIKKGEIDS